MVGQLARGQWYVFVCAGEGIYGIFRGPDNRVCFKIRADFTEQKEPCGCLRIRRFLRCISEHLISALWLVLGTPRFGQIVTHRIGAPFSPSHPPLSAKEQFSGRKGQKAFHEFELVTM